MKKFKVSINYFEDQSAVRPVFKYFFRLLFCYVMENTNFFVAKL